MDQIIKEIVDINENKTVTFAEPFYLSSDKKTIMGEISFKEILFLDYRESEAGSNPREYIGLKKTNTRILQSLLKDYTNMFRFLHSGIILSLVNPQNINDSTLKYDDCCLTNGNQTRFIILIIVLLKLLRLDKELSDITKKEYQEFVKKNFGKNENIMNILKYIKLSKLKQLSNYLMKNSKYLNSFNSMDLEVFLNSKLRLLINIINSIIEDLDDETDTYSAGTLIAEANNDTQNVKADDLFGNKYRNQLNEKLFNTFNEKHQDDIEIEFRYGEIVSTKKKVHILTLLRPVIATGLLTKESDIYKYTNQRLPIYNIFDKVMNKDNINETISAISKLIPLLYEIRVQYVVPYLKEHKRDLIRNYKCKAIAGELDKTIIAQEIGTVLQDDEELEKLIKGSLNYNIEHILPVLIFRIRKNFIEDDNNDLGLTIPENEKSRFFKGLTEAIYKKYVKMKLGGLPTSLTTVVRDKRFYEFGDEYYMASKDFLEIKEKDYIQKNKHIIK